MLNPDNNTTLHKAIICRGKIPMSYLPERFGSFDTHEVPDVFPERPDIVDRPLIQVRVSAQLQLAFCVHALHEVPHGRGGGVWVSPELLWRRGVGHDGGPIAGYLKRRF